MSHPPAPPPRNRLLRLLRAPFALFIDIIPRHLGSALFYVALVLLVSGGAGAGMGVGNLFHDDPFWRQTYAEAGWRLIVHSVSFWTAFGLTTAALVIAWFALNRDLARGARPRVSFAVFLLWLYALGALLAAGLFWVWLGAEAAPPGVLARPGLWFGALAGAALFAAVVVAGRLFADLVAPQMRRHDALRLIAFAAPAGLAFLAVLSFGRVLPAVAILSLALMIYVLCQLYAQLPLSLRAIAAIGLIYLIFIAPQPIYKHGFDGMIAPGGGDHYAAPLKLSCLDDACADGAAAGPAWCASPQAAAQAAEVRARRCVGPAAPRIAPRASLAAWRARFAQKPKLVVIATSGGAYRASFWTAMALDRLSAESGPDGAAPGIAQSVRLITGASGGMVGGAYFAALATPHAPAQGVESRIVADSMASQSWECEGWRCLLRHRGEEGLYPATYPTPRDALSPVAQHLVQRDLPRVLRIGDGAVDRGEALERQWGGLSLDFAALAAGERAGWRPSLILTPMLAETGAPLMISNLDLSGLERVRRGEAREFFRLFPCAAERFSLATAVRMNATFPFISPAVRLPTCEERRVVDAGYYDNYGVTTAVAFLSDPEVMRWVIENTSGVLMIELRAFPLSAADNVCGEAVAETSGPVDASWLISPLTAALSARQSGMASRNAQEWRALKRLYGGAGAPGDDFIARLHYTNSGGGSLNWYLPQREIDAMRACFEQEWGAKLETLRTIWGG